MEQEVAPARPGAEAGTEIFTAIALGGAAEWPFALEALTLPPYGGPPPPDARRQALCCYVLRGTLAVTVEERTVTVRAGEAVPLGPGLAHCYWNPSAAAVELLLIVALAAPAAGAPAHRPIPPEETQ